MSGNPLDRTRAGIEVGIEAGLHLGAQLYVSSRGQTVADQALGEARPGEALRPDHLMLWMSSVKPVTGVAICQQWERGSLGLDDLVCAHLPEFGVKGKERITIRHALTHTAGFPLAAAGWEPTRPWSEIVAEVCDAELAPGWEPGRDAGYHVASAWYVLAEIVRRRDGRPYSRYVREEIFGPLAMEDAWLGMPAEAHERYGGRIAPMYDASGGRPEAARWVWAGTAEGCALERPGGNGWGPARALGRFYEGLLSGGLGPAGGRVLSPQTVEALSTRHTAGLHDRTFGVPLDRGLGVVVDSKRHGRGSDWYGPHCSERAFGHAGYQSSVAFADPEHGLAVAIVWNGMIPHERQEERARATLAALYEDLGLAGRGAAT